MIEIDKIYYAINRKEEGTMEWRRLLTFNEENYASARVAFLDNQEQGEYELEEVCIYKNGEIRYSQLAVRAID